MSLKPDMEPIRVICIVGGKEWLITVKLNPQDKLATSSQEVHHSLPNRKRGSRESLVPVQSKSNVKPEENAND